MPTETSTSHPLTARPAPDDPAALGRPTPYVSAEALSARGKALAARRALLSGLGKHVLRAIEAAGYKVVPKDNGDGS